MIVLWKALELTKLHDKRGSLADTLQRAIETNLASPKLLTIRYNGQSTLV